MGPRITGAAARVHRRTRGRRHQRQCPGRRIGERDQRGLDSRRRPRSRARQKLDAKAELHVDLGSLNCGSVCTGTPSNVDFNTNLVRGGLNFKF
jgi:hypothetical protein